MTSLYIDCMGSRTHMSSAAKDTATSLHEDPAGPDSREEKRKEKHQIEKKNCREGGCQKGKKWCIHMSSF